MRDAVFEPRPTSTPKEDIKEKLGKLYDIVGMVYRTEMRHDDVMDEMALMTAILNGINEHLPFLTRSTTVPNTTTQKTTGDIAPQDTDKGCCPKCIYFSHPVKDGGPFCSNRECECHHPTSPRFTAPSSKPRDEKGDTKHCPKCGRTSTIVDLKNCPFCVTPPSTEEKYGRLRDLIFLEINRAGTSAARGELNPEKHFNTIFTAVQSRLSFEKEKVTSMCVPVHLFIKQKEEMYALGKTQGNEIGRIEAINQIKKIVKNVEVTTAYGVNPNAKEVAEFFVEETKKVILTSLDTI